MASIILSFNPPKNEQDLERLACALFGRHWAIKSLQLNGRRGQRQYGVDFFGCDDRKTIKGGQCKLHELPSELTEQEVLDEVVKAKGFVPQLNCYVIVTTSKRNPALQKLAAQITKEHLSTGLFEVAVYSWDDMCELLNQYSDVREEFFGGASHSTLELMDKKLSSIHGSMTQIQQQASEGKAHAEIEIAVEHLRKGELRIARDRLEQIRRDSWDRLSPRDRFRVVANLGHTYDQEEDFDKAARLFLEAKTFQPEDEQARYLEAIAFDSLGDRAKCFELACQLRRDYPHSGKGFALFIHAAPDEQTLASLEASIPKHVINDAEVTFALARRARLDGELVKAEQYSRVSLKTEPDSFRAMEELGSVLLQRELLKLKDTLVGQITPNLALIEEAVRLFSGILDRFGATCPASIESRIRVKRAAALELLGKTAEAERDVSVAYEKSPDDNEVTVQYSRFLFLQGKNAAAIHSLRQRCAGPRCARHDLLLAEVLSERNQASDSDEALAIASSRCLSLHGDDAHLRSTCVALTVKLLSQRGELAKAEAMLASLPNGYLPEEARLTMLGIVQRDAGRIADAAASAQSAALAVTEKSTAMDKRRLALLLDSLKKYQDSFVLWRGLVGPKSVRSDLYRLLEAARQTKEDRFIMQFCQSMRDSGIFDPEAMNLELNLLQENNSFEKAIALIKAYLAIHSEAALAKSMRVRLSLLGIELDRPELIVRDQALLPRVEDVNASLGRATVLVLLKGGAPQSAADYAYALLRRHFDDPDARTAMVVALGIGHDREIEIPTPESVKKGVAVRYVEDDTKKEDWCIIEDSPSPSASRDELPPEHPVASALIGKRKGDQFALRRNHFQDRTGTIIEIVHKYVYRWRECLETWESRFPDIFFVQRYTVDHQSPDFRPIERSIDCKISKVKSFEDEYQLEHFPLFLLPQVVGGHVFEAVQYLSARNDFDFLCCRRTKQDLESAVAALRTANTLVLDGSALATMFWLKAMRGLANVPVRMAVSEGTMLEAKSWRRALKEACRPGASITKVGERLTMVDNNPEQTKVLVADVDAFLEDVSKKFDVLPGEELAGIQIDVSEHSKPPTSEQFKTTHSLGRSLAWAYRTPKPRRGYAHGQLPEDGTARNDFNPARAGLV